MGSQSKHLGLFAEPFCLNIVWTIWPTLATIIVVACMQVWPSSVCTTIMEVRVHGTESVDDRWMRAPPCGFMPGPPTRPEYCQPRANGRTLEVYVGHIIVWPLCGHFYLIGHLYLSGI